jgi:hypothetical protein
MSDASVVGPRLNGRDAQDAAEELRMGHVRIDECVTQDAKGKPIYDRISAVIQRLSDARSEADHRASAAEQRLVGCEARAKEEYHLRYAAEYEAAQLKAALKAALVRALVPGWQACEWTEQQIGEAVAILYGEGTLDLRLCDWIDHTLQTARLPASPHTGSGERSNETTTEP